MDGNLYFEEHPWKRACTLISNQGKIHQIVVQCVLRKNTLAEGLEQWKERIRQVAGDEIDGDVLKGDHTISYIGVFGDQTIVRIFLDDGEDVSDNFEIVTDHALIVWKPISTNQGHFLSADKNFIESKQKYVEDLQSVSV